MSDIIDEFWIFTTKGEPLIHFQKSQNGENEFDYGLINLDEKSLNEMKNIIIENSKNLTSKQMFIHSSDLHLQYNFARCLKNDSVIFYKTNENAKEKSIKKICETVGHIFEESYKVNQLKFANENLDFFEKFRKKLALYFKLSNL